MKNSYFVATKFKIHIMGYHYKKNSKSNHLYKLMKGLPLAMCLTLITFLDFQLFHHITLFSTFYFRAVTKGFNFQQSGVYVFAIIKTKL